MFLTRQGSHRLLPGITAPPHNCQETRILTAPLNSICPPRDEVGHWTNTEHLAFLAGFQHGCIHYAYPPRDKEKAAPVKRSQNQVMGVKDTAQEDPHSWSLTGYCPDTRSTRDF
ncbi:hypothetical protein P7K49_007942 [Saguinus oedipus]|uniref:Uncharacterized protein n=1 Tax=Saguinus oedipus TaxID=9490 RepID=A0ABQ9VX26_SAGOE|nr:hypothetical protein P7K49_007942 [Saguinus oedipus]